jgi:hypothetical protein
VSESIRALDRRRLVRFPVVVPVVGRAAQGGEPDIRGTVRNVSGCGLMAEFSVQASLGSTVQLTLQASEGPLPVEGRVMWVDHLGDRIRHGLAFPDAKGYAFGLQLYLSEQHWAAVPTVLETTEPFEVWLLRRVGQAEAAGEGPGRVLTDLQGELQAAGQRGEDAGRAVVVRLVADLAGIDRKRAAGVLDSIGAQPTVNREMLMRRIAEAWLEAQRREDPMQDHQDG